MAALDDPTLDRCRELIGRARYAEVVPLAAGVADRARGARNVRLELTALQLLLEATWRTGDHERAIQAAEGVERAAGRLGDDAASAAALLRLGRVYLAINRPEESLRALQEGISADGRGTGEAQSALLAVVADVYGRTGDLARAELLCAGAAQALFHDEDEMQRDPYLTSDPARFEQRVERQLRLAWVAERRRQYHRAAYLLDGIREADRDWVQSDLLEGLDEADRHRLLAILDAVDQVVHVRLGAIRVALEEHGAARAHLERAREAARKISDGPVEIEAEKLLGQVALREGRPDDALLHLERAIELLETGLGRLRVEEFRMSSREMHDEVFEHALEAAHRARRFDDAWKYSERARARVFLNMIAAQNPLGSAPVLGRRADEYARASKLLAQLRDRIVEVGPRSPTARALRRDYEAARNQQAQIVREIGRLWPRGASLAEAEIERADAVLGELDDETALIEFHVATDATYVLTLAGRCVRLTRAPIQREVIAGKVQRLRDLVERRDQVRDIGVTPTRRVPDRDRTGQLTGLAAELYRWLIAPAADLIAGMRRLCLIPHGMFHYLPFAMLGAERPLLADFELVYAPSASVLASVLRASRQPPVHELLVFANPRAGDPSWSLPFTEQEATRIGAEIPSATLVVGSGATATRLREEAPRYDSIHLACHAEFDQAQPLLSGLILAPNPEQDDTGTLTAHEIYTMPLTAGLVVLSACQTGLSSLSGGSEVEGLIRAFMIAGASTVVASQWSVDDASTAELMARMYAHLAKGGGAAHALRAAQLELMDEPDREHPFHWAAFGAHGDWRGPATGTLSSALP